MLSYIQILKKPKNNRKQNRQTCRIKVNILNIFLNISATMISTVLFFFILACNTTSTENIKTETNVEKSNQEIAKKASAEPTSTPPDPLFDYMNGVRYLNAREYDDAIAKLSIVIRLIPDFELPYNYRGVAYYHNEQKQLALEDFNKSIELNPKLAIAYRNRGILHLNLGNNQKARSDLSSAKSIYENENDKNSAEKMSQLINTLN